jgi:hypothetical protein
MKKDIKKERMKERKKNTNSERRKREGTHLQTSITKLSTEPLEVLTTTPTSFIAGDKVIAVSSFSETRIFLTTSMLSHREMFRDRQLCYV